MVSTKPYLIRAIHEWCVDQGFTPYLAVLVDEHTRVPPGYVRDGQIVLNVAPEATHQLVIDNAQVAFQARFNGVAYHIVVPIDNIAAIYARENGQGMAFEPQPRHAPGGASAGENPPPPPDDPPPPRGSHLKVIK
ncbi:MAG: ClpXP protease specificity-enhancing factor [Azoarcus sp.]|jgi:stringent starvation protein B|nr:ClpXP protease specificity-enhancing factor [Azoarcus sp.]